MHPLVVPRVPLERPEVPKVLPGTLRPGADELVDARFLVESSVGDVPPVEVRPRQTLDYPQRE